MLRQRWIVDGVLVLALSVGVQADTLFLRDGSRVQGELIGVRNGTIEFEERRTSGSGRALRFDRDEVVRIEFDNNRNNSGTNFAQGKRFTSNHRARSAGGATVATDRLESAARRATRVARCRTAMPQR
jgi:hypothetical protein